MVMMINVVVISDEDEGDGDDADDEDYFENSLYLLAQNIKTPARVANCVV